MKVNNAVSGLIFIALALAIFFLTSDYPDMPGQAYGPDLFPRLIAVMLAVGGLLLVVKGWQERANVPAFHFDDWCRSPRQVGNFVAVLVVLLFYILVSDWLGFVVTAFASLCALTLWLRGKQHWRSSVVISVLTVITMHQFFGQFLRVPLPWGILQDYAW